MTMEQLRKLERIKESAPGVFDDAYMEAISRAVYDDEGDRQNAVDELMEREVMQWYLGASGFECVSDLLVGSCHSGVKPDFGVAFAAVLRYHETGFGCVSLTRYQKGLTP